MRIQGLGKSVEEQMERFQSNKHWLKKEAWPHFKLKGRETQ
jgi:hypothetical protein